MKADLTLPKLKYLTKLNQSTSPNLTKLNPIQLT